MSNCRGLILAAGRGSRMNNITSTIPKCMVQLGGRPMIDWQLESLYQGGCSRVEIVKGYKSEKVKSDLTSYLNKRWESTNMVSSLFCAPPHEGDTVISYSDIVYNFRHIKELMESHDDITVLADQNWRELWEARFENPLEDAESFSFSNSELLSIGDRAESIESIEAQFMGLLKVTNQGWFTMFDTFHSLSSDEQDNLDMTSLLQIMLAREIKIGVRIICGGWCEADSGKDIELYERLLKTTNWSHDWR